MGIADVEARKETRVGARTRVGGFGSSSPPGPAVRTFAESRLVGCPVPSLSSLDPVRHPAQPRCRLEWRQGGTTTTKRAGTERGVAVSRLDDDAG